ncbi:hypothetical protein E2C01_027784 [Portunus trituberculatus]|uniref:Uncharacterized protein n=1 Tax=Portunus trituberculatus TaxID=210409 RepID=A0A5B7EM92_PORTR|nr:hypothetical protein [Portunus trituberculatus]
MTEQQTPHSSFPSPLMAYVVLRISNIYNSQSSSLGLTVSPVHQLQYRLIFYANRTKERPMRDESQLVESDSSLFTWH